MKKIALSMLVVSTLVLTGCTRIGPGYVGIRVSLAGDNRGVDSLPTTTGWNFYNPGLTQVVEYPTFVQQVQLEGEAEEITFTTKDQMKVSADISFAYAIAADKVPHFYVKFRNDDLYTFSHGYLRSLIRDKFNEVGGRYAIEGIMGPESAQFLTEVKQATNKVVNPYGVILEDQFGFIGAPRPPQGVIEMINSKVQAVQIAQQKQNELVQVQADMAKEREKTDTYSRNTLKFAEAQAQANKLLSESISSNLLELKRLEKWNGVLPQVTGQGAIPMFQVK